MDLIGSIHVGADAHLTVEAATYSDCDTRCFLTFRDCGFPNLTISLPIAQFERAKIAAEAFNQAMKGSEDGSN